MKQATYNVPHAGMAGMAANTLMHLAAQTGNRTSRKAAA
jgi:hypothetical protein